MRCTMLFNDPAEVILLTQIMPGADAVIISAGDTWCADIETFWCLRGGCLIMRFCVYTRCFSQAVYISGMFE